MKKVTIKKSGKRNAYGRPSRRKTPLRLATITEWFTGKALTGGLFCTRYRETFLLW